MAEKNAQSVTRQEKAGPVEIAANALVPPVDIFEDKEVVTLFADLPGINKEGLEVHIDKGTLQISGKRAAKDYSLAESNYTEMPEKDYYRAFTIGEEIDREKISAHLNNGVLKVVLPKVERAKPKKIDIKY
jgi:HSP20 family molecular chaperone IbpA